MTSVRDPRWDAKYLIVNELGVDTVWDGRIKNLVYNTTTMDWEPQASGASGGSVSPLVDLRREQEILFSKIDINSSGQNIIIAANATKKIKLLSYTFVSDGAVNIKFQSGNTDLTGAMNFTSNGGISSPIGNPGSGWLMETAVNQSLNINLSAAIGLRGHISFFMEA